MNDLNLHKVDTGLSMLLVRGEQGLTPSYGKLYLKAFSEYVNDHISPRQAVDDIIEIFKNNNIGFHGRPKCLILGTGHGPHENAILNQGFELVGLDICLESLLVAKEKTKNDQGFASHVVADMTYPLPFASNYFDFLFSLGTSFGFSPDDTVNQGVFVQSKKVLKKNGYLVFDAVNINGILPLKQKNSTFNLPGGLIRREEFDYDNSNNTSLTKITLVEQGRDSQSFHHFMKYYSLDQITRMLQVAGFKIISTFGDLKGSPYNEFQSGSIVVIAQKQTL